MGTNTEQRKLAAILSSRMVGHGAVALYDEVLVSDLLREHLDLLRDIFPMFDGREIKSRGDGLLVEFSSALAAAQCAVEIQRTLGERNEKKTEDRHIRVRIGIHLGEVVWRANEVLGDGVDIATRIEPLAEPGGICVTRAVFEQIENKLPQPCVQLSQPELNSIPANVNVYKLVLEVSPAEIQTAAASRKQLQWLVLGVVVLNMVLFLMFGLVRKPDKPADTASTNAPVPAVVTNRDQR